MSAVALWEGHNEVVNVGFLRGSHYPRVIYNIRSIGNILFYGCVEQMGLLRDDGDSVAKPQRVSVTESMPVERDETTSGLVQSLQETRDGRLAAPRCSNDCNTLAVLDLHIEILEDLNFRARGVGEGDMVERNLSLEMIAGFSLGLHRLGLERDKPLEVPCALDILAYPLDWRKT